MRRKMREARRAEAGGGGRDGGIDLADGAVDRQHHVGQQHMHHADQHAGEIVQQRDRIGDDTGLDQRAIEHAVAAEQHHPGVGAHQHRGPERQQHEDEADRRPEGRRRGHQEAQRIAQQQAEEGDQQRDLERVPEDAEIELLAQRLGVPVERAALDAEAQHAHDREQEEHEQQDQRRQRGEEAAGLHGAKSSSTVIARGSSLSDSEGSFASLRMTRRMAVVRSRTHGSTRGRCRPSRGRRRRAAHRAQAGGPAVRGRPRRRAAA